jgi:hypothetical protein
MMTVTDKSVQGVEAHMTMLFLTGVLGLRALKSLCEELHREECTEEQNVRYVLSFLDGTKYWRTE